MKSASRSSLIIIGLALLIGSGLAMTAEAQNREKYVISATAGGINYVSGNVTVQRRGALRQEALTATDDLKTGDSVTTAPGGRVEVLLNPGSYMRVDERSEFELADASLDSLRVKLVKGSAILEVTGADGMRLEIGVQTPQTEAVIIKRGIYRFNVLPNETTEISVRKGRALYGRGLSNEIKGGQKVLIGQKLLEVAKLEKKNQDTLDLWSKERAETLAHANRKLQSRALVAAMNSFNERDSFGRGWSARYGSGLWVYNSRLGIYCFMPLGWRYWSSPYGYDYPTAFGFAGAGPNWIPRNGYPSSGNGTTGNTGGNPSPATTVPPPTWTTPSSPRVGGSRGKMTPMNEAPPNAPN
ncbi:MAG: hypothetical protein QOH25_1861 [Acidobacteriota bacterium]|jgi:hypothetical protein|nr:hypothetical protein [Acidobacteriota bacterium]